MRKWIVIATTCCCLGAAFAASNVPVPGALERTAHPLQQATDKIEPAPSDQRRTEDRPLFMQIRDASKTQARAPATEDQYGGKAALAWGMTAEEHTAVATYALVAVGALTAVVLICQSILLRQTVNGAREEFRASHPPELRIKHVIARGDIWGGKPVRVSLVLVNIGKSTAYIRDFNICAVVLPSGKRLPPEPTFPARNRNPVPPLARGIALHTDEMSVHAKLTQEEQDGIFHASRTHILYCYGYVQYSDQPTGIEGFRKTAFCRTWEPQMGAGGLSLPGRFVLHDDPDYEYQE
jgi:hypothetical protein